MVDRASVGNASAESVKAVTGLECPKCSVKKEKIKPLSLARLSEAKCEKCGGIMLTDITHSIKADSPLAGRTLREVGVAPFDIVRVATGEGGKYVRLDGDREEILAWS